MTAVDVLVVGQGFAGTALAWHLRWRGASVLVVDRDDADTASRVAAGLLTPVTGKRLAPTREFGECLSVATAFYRRAEADTGERFFQQAGAVRLFADASERELYVRKSGADLDPPVRDDWFAAPHGGFGMPAAARLAAEPYLRASQRHFAAAGAYRVADLDPARDLEPAADGVRIPRLDVTAGRVVFCQGAAGVGNRWFPDVPLRPDAGEVLTVRVPGLDETRTVHRGVWLTPAGGDRFRVGATYARGVMAAMPTAAGRAELCGRLGAFLRLPVTVEGHRAAARPVPPDHRPQVRVSGGEPRVWWFNGLGSKGALTAPAVAARVVGFGDTH